VAADDHDEALRAAMVLYLDGLLPRNGGQVWHEDLSAFAFRGQRIPLLQHMRGIRVVAGLPAALTIRTTFRANPDDLPYVDAEGPDGYFRYKWRGTDPDAHDNVALRRALELGKPLAWFVGVAAGWFVPVYPVWLVGEEPLEHQFVMAFDELMQAEWRPELLEHPVDLALRRKYAEATVRRRLHQPVFRRRVLTAYRSQCALCRLRHEPLLDAAHIKEDADGGLPIVTNGVAMCAIHHRPFDSNVLGIRPDYIVHIRDDVLAEQDGPTLQHALQGLHGGAIALPRQVSARPDPDLLEERFDRFLVAS
jgi:putative restriction endonuclease